MCGIAGMIAFSRDKDSDSLRASAERMATALRSRGPDDGGVWVDPAAGIALGHRRLSILDLSPQGHQPMESANGRYVVVFNGEIYNHGDIRRRLARSDWRGHSDTEVMLAAIQRWGVSGAVELFNGMFAFALWDKHERALHLVRDRLGEKPLYYGWTGKTFLFGSELRALRAHPEFAPVVDRRSLSQFMRFNNVPAPRSIYRGVSKLLPGHILRIDASDKPREEASSPYWSASAAAASGLADPLHSATDAVSGLDALIRDSVRIRMEADVPLGAFLSGGVDSSTIVAAMQSQSARRVKTFTIGFHEAEFDEAIYARAVAAHLGTDHTELYVTPELAMSVIPKLATIYDEPFSDSSQIPTFLVSELARQHVTVCLTGDGGDEVFGGYNRYIWGQDIWGAIGWVPRSCRAAAAGLLRTISPGNWDRAYRGVGSLMPSRLRAKSPGDRLHKFADVLDVESSREMYERLVSHWTAPSPVIVGNDPPERESTSRPWPDTLPSIAERMMLHDTVTYLPDDNLVKGDRASMAVSLEGRIPFLDHRIVEYAWRIPLEQKLRRGGGKDILKRVLARYIPEHLIDRPKMGFTIPIGAWLRGPLREWAEALLSEERLQREGFLHAAPIRAKWLEHLSGRRNWENHLWDVLIFQSWLEKWT